MFSGGILQALPVSQHDLIEHLPFGVLLTDRRGTVIDVNPAAAAPARHLRGAGARTQSRVGDGAARTPRCSFESVPVRSAGREAGQLVLLDPPRKSS